MNSHRSRAVGIALGFAADRALADPVRLHPVAGFGRLALALEDRLYPADVPGGGAVSGAAAARARGIVFTAALVGGTTLSTATLDRLLRRRPVVRTAATAAIVWACLGGTSLLRIAEAHADLLARGDIPGSRTLLPWLCGRDPVALEADDLARAVVESVAENTADAAVATVFWAAVAGPAGAVAHRAANTLDAMVGHRSERYAGFGWASARLDDVLGWPAARLAGSLTAALAPLVAGSPRRAARIWLRDARGHPSPNAGVVEAACAGALGVRLGGRTPYPYGVQMRQVLGDGPAPRPADVRRAGRLMRSVQGAAAVAATVAAGMPGTVSVPARRR